MKVSSGIQSDVAIKKITSFLQTTFQVQKKAKAVIAVSGGIDSTLSLTLLMRALSPKNILVLFLPYGEQDIKGAELAASFNHIPSSNIIRSNIKSAVDSLVKLLQLSEAKLVRKGNVIARTRMIVVYDTARQHQALVCGTENKSEKYLGYFTRFGDEAADVEPLIHLYKTQVRQLAKYLKLPREILDQPPSAGLWKGQTDERELGFSYHDADQVLHQLIDLGKTAAEITIDGLEVGVIQRVVSRVKGVGFKLKTPYKIKTEHNIQ